MDDNKSLSESYSDAKQHIPDNAFPDRDVVFYYSREHRLARASSTVRALNESGLRKRPGLFNTFIAARPHILLLVVVVILCVFISFMSKFTKEKSTFILGGNSINASAVQIQGATYLTIRKTYTSKNNSQVYTGTVDIAISPSVPAREKAAQESAPIAAHRIFFTLKSEEEYDFPLPFEASTLLILMQAEDKYITFKVKPR